MERSARLVLSPVGGTVELDGQDVSHLVRGFELTQEVGHRPQLTLDLSVHQVITHGRATILMAEETKDLLVSFGWVPPEALALTVDTIRDPARRDAALNVLRDAVRLDPTWFSALLRHEARVHGGGRLDHLGC
ncbi:hypothetical protein [Streptomyces sp. NPDC058612]|uniref:hypothetical protein n=1 Tax=Streptomyces sp. NPDC058612 TaxID=3346555 RepID=UPI003649CEAF